MKSWAGPGNEARVHVGQVFATWYTVTVNIMMSIYFAQVKWEGRTGGSISPPCSWSNIASLEPTILCIARPKE